MSETPIAFARWCLCGIETAIAFADAKSVFLAQFLGAVVLVVSMSPRYRALCAKKFSLHAQNTPKSAFLRLLANFFAEEPLEGPYWVNFFAETRLERLCWANFFAETPLEGARRASFSRTGTRGIPRGELCCAAGLGRWALLLAVLTLRYAATPT